MLNIKMHVRTENECAHLGVNPGVIIPAVSPEVDAQRVDGGVEITVKDYRHTETVMVQDGERGPRGEPGPTGAPGTDGVSPEATVTQTDTGATITITDAAGTTTAQIANGQDGAPGAQGAPGAPGADGVSPTISVTDIPGGHRVTITDATGAHSFDVLDGTDYGYGERITSLSGTALANGTVIEAIGIPEYVDDVSQYVAYGIDETGWYVFARIAAPDGVTVTAETTVEGAAGAIITAGADHVDVAVLFGVTAESQKITVTWGGTSESFVFKADDLAVRNLDYRTTFYIYDITPYCHWDYALTTDATFVAGKAYYTEADGVYTLAEVTAGVAVPAETYYNHSKLHFEGMVANVTYKLDTIVDCPIEIALPVVAEDGHGAWFEVQMRYNDSYSCTLLPPEGVKIGTATTQSQTAGVNTIDLQYTDAGEVKMWTLLNTHSNIPT